jgi:Uma2 family endonuclease
MRGTLLSFGASFIKHFSEKLIDIIALEKCTKQLIIMNGIVLNLDDVGLTDEQFYNICQKNRDWQFERNARGELIIMPPVGGISGNREADLITEVTIWNRQTRLGKVFSSSTIFRLPNGGDRSPDVEWIKLEKWNNLTEEEQEKFPPICPDFVIELRSRTDSLNSLQNKMQEYLNSGLSLGWLINPQDREVEIYRSKQTVEIVKFPAILSGEDILPGFSLNLPI